MKMLAAVVRWTCEQQYKSRNPRPTHSMKLSWRVSQMNKNEQIFIEVAIIGVTDWIMTWKTEVKSSQNLPERCYSSPRK